MLVEEGGGFRSEESMVWLAGGVNGLEASLVN